MWYSPNDTLTKQRLFNFDCGARGCGKTTGTIKYIIEQKKKDPLFEAVWVRRYKEERKTIKDGFFDNIITNEFFPDDKLTIKGNKGYYNDQPLIHFAALSVDARVKGITSPNVRFIVFDEFMPDNGAGSYLANEVNRFLSFYDTVARPNDPKRKRVPVLFLSNAMSIINPYFLFFNVRFNESGKFYGKNVFAQLLHDAEFIENSKATEFASLIEGTEYYSHSILNTFINDNTDFIAKKSAAAKNVATLVCEKKEIGVWIDWDEGNIYLSAKVDPSCKNRFSFTKDDMQPNTLTSRFFKSTYLYSQLSNAYNHASMFYETLEIKDKWYKIIRIANI